MKKPLRQIINKAKRMSGDSRSTDKIMEMFLSAKEVTNELLKPVQNSFYSPTGYVTWAKHIKAIATEAALIDIKNTTENEEGYKLRHRYFGASSNEYMYSLMSLYSIATRGPARYISKSLMDVIWKTDPPVSIEVPELPLPCFHLFLPESSRVILPSGSSISVITVIDNRTFTGYMNSFIKNEADRFKEDDPHTFPGLRILAISSKHELVHATRLWRPIKGVFDISSSHFDKDYVDIGFHLLGIAANVSLAMLAEPELVTTGELPPGARSGAGFSPGAGPAPSPPVWIGRNYKRPSSSSQVGDGEGTSLKPHWRRGHWHQVCCGKGRKERKVQWFKPVYVNA